MPLRSILGHSIPAASRAVRSPLRKARATLFHPSGLDDPRQDRYTSDLRVGQLPSSSGLGRRPLTAKTGVRVPLGALLNEINDLADVLTPVATAFSYSA